MKDSWNNDIKMHQEKLEKEKIHLDMGMKV